MTLREKFFNECVDLTSHKVNLAPHDMFEWFNKNIEEHEKIIFIRKSHDELIKLVEIYKDEIKQLRKELREAGDALIHHRQARGLPVSPDYSKPPKI